MRRLAGLAFGVTLLMGCGNESMTEEDRLWFCLEQIRDDAYVPADCRDQAPEICYELSRDLPMAVKARTSFISARAQANGMAKLFFGTDTDESWTREDCTAVHREICWRITLLMPCQYESCVKSIPKECSRYKQ